VAHYDYDLFIIGAGSGGVRAANAASALGATVAIAEDRDIGGTCVNVGCVPKKLLVYAAQFQEQFHAAQGFGWKVGPSSFNWETLITNKNREIERLQNVYRIKLLDSGVTIVNGKAQILDAHTVAVANEQYRAERILVATGGWPFIPDIPGKEYIVTSNDMFFLKHLPRSIIIVGGGYIAVEFACIMHGFGVRTTICHRGHKLLKGFDEEVADVLTQTLRKKGIEILFNTDVQAIEKTSEGYTVAFAEGEKQLTDLVMFATGRTPNITGIGLETLGVVLDEKKAIVVNDHYQSNIPSIYAVGDVTDRINLTPVAIAESQALARHLFSKQTTPVDYENIPSAVFCLPSIGSVGLTEAQAREKYPEIAVFKTSFTPIKNTLSAVDEKTFMKMIVVSSTDRVVGIHMLGTDAPEIIQGMAVAMRVGATKAQFDSTIGIHPTAAEEFVTLS